MTKFKAIRLSDGTLLEDCTLTTKVQFTSRDRTQEPAIRDSLFVTVSADQVDKVAFEGLIEDYEKMHDTTLGHGEDRQESLEECEVTVMLPKSSIEYAYPA